MELILSLIAQRCCSFDLTKVLIFLNLYVPFEPCTRYVATVLSCSRPEDHYALIKERGENFGSPAQRSAMCGWQLMPIWPTGLDVGVVFFGIKI